MRHLQLVNHRRGWVSLPVRSWLALPTLLLLTTTQPAQALPPPDDPPEEVLRTEIILDARSNLDGDPLTAAEYVQEQEAIAQSAYAPELDSQIQHIVFLLQIRQALKPILPFLP